MTDRRAMSHDFLSRAGWGSAVRTPLAGDASARHYERVRLNGKTAVLMDAPPAPGQDVGPFLRIGAHLRKLGLSAPAVLAQDEINGFLLLEDLGDALFSRAIAADAGLENRLYSSAIEVLADLARHAPPQGLIRLDAVLMGQMVQPVVDWYLPGATGTAGDPAPLGHLVETLAGSLVTGPEVLMLRDFHAENLIWLPDRTGVARVGLLDFQDAMAAHPAYDLVSILQDARRDVPPGLETAMIARYADLTGQETAQFAAAYALLGAQRNLRILGVFARLCMHYGKVQYVGLIPRVWSYLQRDLTHPALAPLADLAAGLLPEPTPDRLQRIADKCGTIPTL